MKWFGTFWAAVSEYFKFRNRVPQKEIEAREAEKTDWKTVNADKKQLRMMVNFLEFWHHKEQKLRGEKKTSFKLLPGQTIPGEYWKKKRDLENEKDVS